MKKSLFSHSPRNRSTEQKRKSRVLDLEKLQERWTPVVGAFSVPVPMDNANETGVVRLSINRTDGNFLCTGTLLSTGQHVLTAAHCLTNSNGQLTAMSVDVNFDVKASPTASLNSQSYPVGTDGITIHPSWNGDGDGNYGHDLAILKLSELAPLYAKRYELYRNTDEVGKTFDIVGYGRRGTGSDGDNLAPDGNRRQGRNRVDDVEYDPWYNTGTAGPKGSVLIFDFDEASSESFVGRGDSGGPMLMDGKVGGVYSAGFETAFLGGDPEANFGEVASASRVSYYQTWIDSVTSADRYVSFNLGRELARTDGNQTRVEIVQVGTNVDVYLNSRLHDSIPASAINQLTVVGTNSSETFILNDPTRLTSRVIVAGNSGDDTLFALNGNNNFVIADWNMGTIQGRHAFYSIETVAGGFDNDTFKFGPSGRLSGAIDGGAGLDTLDYAALMTGVIVNLTTGTASRTGGVYLIENVTGGSGHDSITGNNLKNVLVGGAGDDRLYGLDGDDRLWGGQGDDHLYGGRGADRLYGEADNDRLDGGIDDVSDLLVGGLGVDTFVGQPTSGPIQFDIWEDFINGFDIRA